MESDGRSSEGNEVKKPNLVVIYNQLVNFLKRNNLFLWGLFFK